MWSSWEALAGEVRHLQLFGSSRELKFAPVAAVGSLNYVSVSDSRLVHGCLTAPAKLFLLSTLWHWEFAARAAMASVKLEAVHTESTLSTALFT